MLVYPVTDYDGLCDAMFHMIRQNAAGSVHVLGRMLDVLTRVAEVERLTDRAAELARHADLVIAAPGATWPIPMTSPTWRSATTGFAARWWVAPSGLSCPGRSEGCRKPCSERRPDREWHEAAVLRRQI